MKNDAHYYFSRDNCIFQSLLNFENLNLLRLILSCAKHKIIFLRCSRWEVKNQFKKSENELKNDPSVPRLAKLFKCHQSRFPATPNLLNLVRGQEVFHRHGIQFLFRKQELCQPCITRGAQTLTRIILQSKFSEFFLHCFFCNKKTNIKQIFMG